MKVFCRMVPSALKYLQTNFRCPVDLMARQMQEYAKTDGHRSVTCTLSTTLTPRGKLGNDTVIHFRRGTGSFLYHALLVPVPGPRIVAFAITGLAVSPYKIVIFLEIF